MGPCAGSTSLALTFGSGSPEAKAAHEASAQDATGDEVAFAQPATFELLGGELAWDLEACAEGEFRDCLGGCDPLFLLTFDMYLAAFAFLSSSLSCRVNFFWFVVLLTSSLRQPSWFMAS